MIVAAQSYIIRPGHRDTVDGVPMRGSPVFSHEGGGGASCRLVCDCCLATRDADGWMDHVKGCGAAQNFMFNPLSSGSPLMPEQLALQSALPSLSTLADVSYATMAEDPAAPPCDVCRAPAGVHAPDCPMPVPEEFE